jgi:hypothetical protein
MKVGLCKEIPKLDGPKPKPGRKEIPKHDEKHDERDEILTKPEGAKYTSAES